MVVTGPARKLVVVVDDDAGVLKAVGRLLKAHGLELELFGSVHEFHGRAHLERSTCLILDMNLNGESGIEVRRKLSEKWPSIPVIFITANDNEGTRRAAIDAGCLAYLVKPFSAESLLDAVAKASAEPQCRLPVVLASRNLIFFQPRPAKQACATGESSGTLRMTASTRSRKS